MNEYIVFWTYLGNYAENPKRIKASDIKEAILKSTGFDPYAKSKSGKMMSFLVFEVGNDLVFNGTINTLEE